jgi:hypothetical protein
MELHKFKLKISRTHINPLLEDLTLYLEDIKLTKNKTQNRVTKFSVHLSYVSSTITAVTWGGVVLILP